MKSFANLPKWGCPDKPNSAEQTVAYRQAQWDTVLAVVREYNPTIPVIQNLDFGHTDPQVALPMGHKARLDGAQKSIFLTY